MMKFLIGDEFMVEAAGEAPFGNMMRQMGKMMEQMNKGFYTFSPSETWMPQVNLYENDTAYIVCVDLAGVDKDKIDLTVIDGQLKLRGQRPTPIMPGTDSARVQRLRVHLMEIDHGPFSREVEVPRNVARDKIVAKYVDGMLWIELPKV